MTKMNLKVMIVEIAFNKYPELTKKIANHIIIEQIVKKMGILKLRDD